MLKLLYYFTNRFTKKNIAKMAAVYAGAILIFLIYGVKGLMTVFFLILFFFLGWISNKLTAAIKDYRLTLRLNRVHFSHVDYETLRRENSALLEALQAHMKGAVRGRGVQGGGYPPSPSTPNTGTRLSHEQVEEMRMRYEAEDRER